MATGKKCSVLVLIIGYWAVLAPLAWLAYFAYPDYSWTSIPTFWGCQVIVWLVSFFSSQLSFIQWYREIFFYGVRPIAHHMITISKMKNKVYIAMFEFWWCFCIKFIFPWAIYWLLVMTIQKDTTERYENYYIGW